MPFPPPPYSAALLTSIRRTVTNERLLRYLGATDQNLPNALILYEYNITLSEIMYGLLHGLEVSVRNAIHHALTTSYGTADWYDHAALSAYWRDQVNNAKGKVQTTTGAVQPGKVVAEMTFGFWVDLTGKSYNNPLWLGHKLNAAFPHAAPARHAIHTRLKAVQLLRNRISHHERILTSRNRLYNGNALLTLPEVRQCVEWVCPETAGWLGSRFRYTEAHNILAAVTTFGVAL
jgi:hypothetical protein